MIWQNKKISQKHLENCSLFTLILIQAVVFRKFKAHVFINTPETLYNCLLKLRNSNFKRKDEMIKHGIILLLNVLKKINRKQKNFY